MADDNVVPDWCRRCGSRRLDYSACHCVTVAGPEREVALLAEAARHDRRARRWLAGLSNPSARRPLEKLVADEEVDGKLAQAALSALSRIGADESFDLLLSERAARLGTRHVVRYLRERGDERARTELASRLGGAHAVEAAMALAELGDRRATPVLLDAVAGAGRWSRWSSPFDPNTVVDHPLAGLVRLRDPVAVEPLRQMARDAAALDARIDELVAAHTTRPDRGAYLEQCAKDNDITADMIEPILEQSARGESLASIRANAASKARSTLVELVVALVELDPAGSRELIDRAVTVLDFDPREVTARPLRTSFDAPLRHSTVALEIDAAFGPADHPGTRFGGEPTWLAEPTWPLTDDRTPMAFWGQLAWPDDSHHMVYVFVDPDDEPEEFDSAAVSVFAQPAGRPNSPFAIRSTGPAVSSTAAWMSSRPPSAHASASSARVPSLRPFSEPVDWEQAGLLTGGPETMNKIGGTPFWIRDPLNPPTGFEFVAQFDAERAGHVIGHAGTCFVFVHPESGDGWFGWQA